MFFSSTFCSISFSSQARSLVVIVLTVCISHQATNYSPPFLTGLLSFNPMNWILFDDVSWLLSVLPTTLSAFCASLFTPYLSFLQSFCLFDMPMGSENLSQYCRRLQASSLGSSLDWPFNRMSSCFQICWLLQTYGYQVPFELCPESLDLLLTLLPSLIFWDCCLDQRIQFLLVQANSMHDSPKLERNMVFQRKKERSLECLEKTKPRKQWLEMQLEKDVGHVTRHLLFSVENFCLFSAS